MNKLLITTKMTNKHNKDYRQRRRFVQNKNLTPQEQLDRKNYFRENWEKYRVQNLRCKMTGNTNEKDLYKNETIFEFFTRISTNDHIRLFSRELQFAGVSGNNILETYYKKLKKKGLTSKEHFRKGNGFYNAEGVSEHISMEFSTILYACILEFSNRQKGLSQKLENVTEHRLNKNPREEFKLKFIHAFKHMLEFQTVAYIDKHFIEMLNQVITPKEEEKETITGTPKEEEEETITGTTEEIALYLSQLFKHIFLRTFYQNKATPVVKRTTLAFELGLGILQYIILREDNTHLNSFINILNPENFHSISKSRFEKIVNFVKIMQAENNELLKEDFMKEMFSYTTKKKKNGVIEIISKKINPLYYDLILDHLYDLVYQLFSDYPKYISELFEKHEEILNPQLHYNINYKRRLIRYGNFLLNHLCDLDICKAQMVFKNKKTVSVIMLTETSYISGLEDLFSLNKPMLFSKPYHPKAFESVLEKDYLDLFPSKSQTCLQYLLQYKIKNRRIHKKEDLSLEFKKKKKEHEYTPKTKYKIELEVLRFFLDTMISHVLSQRNEEMSSYHQLEAFINEKNESAENILIFFELSYEHLNTLLKKYPNLPENHMYHDALYDILRFMLTYTNLDYTTTKEKILGKNKNKSYNGFLDIKALLDKVLQYKLNLVGLIKDAILYSRFEYFVADSYLDARGRVYNSESFLNIQNNPKAKMFVSIYQDPSLKITIKTLEILRQHLSVHTIDKNNSSLFNFEKIPKTDLDDFKDSAPLDQTQETILDNFYLENRKVYIASLRNLLSKDLNEETFNDFLKQCGHRDSLLDKKTQIKLDRKNKVYKKINYLNRNEQLKFIKTYAKKVKNSWTILKAIIKLCHTTPKRKHLITEYDCNNSGSQNIAVLLNNIRLAEEANLIGKEEFDSYTDALNQYNTVIKVLQKLFFEFKTVHELSDLSTKIKKQAIFTTTKIESLSKDTSKFMMLLQYNILDSPGLQTLLLKCYSLFKFQVIPKIAILYCLIPQKEKNLILDLTKGFKNHYIEFCMYMLVLRVAVNLELYYKKYPWLSPTSNVWKERDIFKKPLMTSYYNATRFTRIKYFQKFFLDYSKIHQQIITEYDLYYLANNLELFFKKLSKSKLKGLEYMKNLTKMLIDKSKSKKNCPIIISNTFFNITMKAPAYKSLQIETRTLKNKKQQLSILIPDNKNVNFKSLSNSLSPNIIHSMDAWLVHTFNNKIQKINVALEHSIKSSYKHKAPPFQIVSYTNHDNFACNIPVILPLLLKEAYSNLINENYILMLELLKEEDIQLLGLIESGKTLKEVNLEFKHKFDTETNPRFIK